MKKYLGIWTFLYLAASYFVYGWINTWRYKVECYNNGHVIYDCAPNTQGIQLLLLVIIPAIGIITGLLFWKKQHVFSKILLAVSLALAIFFLIEVLTPPILG